MSGPKFIEIEDRRHLWRDIVQIRQEQCRAAAEPVQPPLFELHEDYRPVAELRLIVFGRAAHVVGSSARARISLSIKPRSIARAQEHSSICPNSSKAPFNSASLVKPARSKYPKILSAV